MDMEATEVAEAMEAVEVDMEAMAMENKKGDSLNNAAKKPISYLRFNVIAQYLRMLSYIGVICPHFYAQNRILL